MIAAVAVEPFAFFSAAELTFLVRRQALHIAVRFGSCWVADLSGLDDYFLLRGIGSDGNFTKFALKHVERLLG